MSLPQQQEKEGSQHLPGMGRTLIVPLMAAKPTTQPKPIVLIGTSNITEKTIFMNGLYQNVYFIYRLCELIGCMPFLFVPEKKPFPAPMDDCRILVPEDVIQQRIPVSVYFEVAMSVDKGMRDFFKSLGARVCKLYLGNILNIDAETPMFHSQMNFSHHVVGGMDEIWVSPHYAQHADYAAVINGLSPADCKIAAYVWEPEFFEQAVGSSTKWLPAVTKEETNFFITEPNISFQKCSIIPLLIAEEYFRQNPTWKGKVFLYNAPQLSISPFFIRNILPTLELNKQGRIEMRERKDIAEVLKENPHSIPICHHVNNEYNYMTLELLWAGYPVVHNADSWADAGYTYSGASIEGGVKALKEAVEKGKENKTITKSQGRVLAWRHSIHNPDNQDAWKKLLGI